MIILDTDHITVLRYSESEGYANLTPRMRMSDDGQFATTIITVEEQMRGWLALIARFREVTKQVTAYERLAQMLAFLTEWDALPFDQNAASRFEDFRRQKIRIGSADLKIASIAVVNDALLLSSNAKDFHLVPGLRVEDWRR